ncbi:MAG: Zn-ribbon domain-containing OB-fold protein [Aquabacterium sp.]
MATPYQPRELPDPVVYPDNAEFWRAAGEGRLLLRHCDACGEPHWYPRPICPLCGSDRTSWRQASGRGTVYSVSVTRGGGAEPYAIAYVTLEEGVTMMTNIVDTDLDHVRIGDAVELVFKPSAGGQAVPMFRPRRA